MVGHAFDPSTEENLSLKPARAKTLSQVLFFFFPQREANYKTKTVYVVLYSIMFSLKKKKMQNVKPGLVICTPAILSQTKKN